MRKFLKVLSVSCLSLLMTFMMIVPASAEEQIVITNNNLNELDKYVIVENNQFVLEIPNSVEINDSLLSTVNNKLFETNAQIRAEGLTIDPDTKTAVQPIGINGIQARSYGKNDIVWRWNSFTAYLDAGMVQVIAGGGIAAISTALSVPGWAAVVISGALGAAGVFSQNITDGIWIDVNHFGVLACGIAAGATVGMAVIAMAGISLRGGSVCGVTMGLQ